MCRLVKRASLISLVVLAIVSVLELSAVAADNTVLEHLTKPLLLPLLIIFVLIEVGWNADPSIKFLVIGQFFSFLGDVALMFDGDLWFALGIGMFLITHIFYLIGFFKIGVTHGLPVPQIRHEARADRVAAQVGDQRVDRARSWLLQKPTQPVVLPFEGRR